MLKIVNRLFVVLVLLALLGGALLSLVVIFFPGADGFELEAVKSMDQSPDFLISAYDVDVQAEDSPYPVEYIIYTPTLKEFDQVYLEIYSEGRFLTSIACLQDFDYAEDFLGRTDVTCTAQIPYYYSKSQEYLVFATIYGDDYEYASGPAVVNANWMLYEDYFWEVSIFFIMGLAAVYIFIVFPITLAIAFIASKMKHHDEEYTIFSLLNPFANKKTLLQKFNSFLISPYFWLFEIFGIFLILIYMVFTAQIWKSETALIAFVVSGLMAFIVPFLWCAAWWYADFREREPVRVLITFFLWGMLAALMSIGINTVMGFAFELIGLGFLSTLIITPIAEEFNKGSGLALLGEHREFNSIEDGVVFGFVIGMGFSFIEDWIYLLSSPMGSDVLSWFIIFIVRSIVFSANHGFYTAIIGGIIGFLIERNFRAPALGLLVGLPIAVIFHAAHNSSEMLSAIFGAGGLLAYCCLLVPLFDYGGLIVLLAVFIWALLRHRPK